MPSFSFSVIKKVTKKNKSISNNKDIIVLSKVRGIVFINLQGDYYVELENGEIYPINKDCYSCKGHKEIYRQGEFDRCRFIYVRHQGEYFECNTKHWLPFGIGCIVKGNVIQHHISKQKTFVIKKCGVDFDNPRAIAAMQFYKNNIDEINTNIKLKCNET
jgi:hypothetical protein